MEILNLVSRENSDIRYELINFPDGQPHIKFLSEPSTKEIKIMSRMSSPSDLLLILFATEWLRFQSRSIEIHLYVPYLFAARMDRRMEPNQPFSLRVVANIINSAQFETVTVCDVHSSVADILIDRLVDEGCPQLYETVLNGINFLNYVLVQPDKGAETRTKKFAHVLGYQSDIAVADKTRDGQGKIIRYSIYNMGGFRNNARAVPVIIDDIYDGGATFDLLANEVGNYSNAMPILVVTHGIFSRGYATAAIHFSQIFVTNSYKDIMKEVEAAFPVKNVDKPDSSDRVNLTFRKKFIVTDVFTKTF